MPLDMTQIVPPKWFLKTKRGWGMVLTFVSPAVPAVAGVIKAWTGYDLSADVVAAVGGNVTQLLDVLGTTLGLVLWVWGSFRPTAPLTVKKPKEAPVV